MEDRNRIGQLQLDTGTQSDLQASCELNVLLFDVMADTQRLNFFALAKHCTHIVLVMGSENLELVILGHCW